MTTVDRTRVAVIGSGLAGLVTAYLLVLEGCEVFLIEKSEKIGFHSASVEIPISGDKGDGDERWVTDVPMRSFQGGYYPLLISLYRHLGIPLKEMYYDYSFSSITGSERQPSTYFIHSGASGHSLPSFPRCCLESLRAFISGCSIWLYTAACYLALVLLAFLSWHGIFQVDTLQGLLEAFPLPIGHFVHNILVPIFSAVGTMTTQDVLRTPLAALLEYVHTTLGTAHYTLGSGHTAEDVANKLLERVKAQGKGHIRLASHITDIRIENQVRLVMGDEHMDVDKVVVATQAGPAANLLDMMQAKGDERKRIFTMRDGLNGIEYRETIVVTHRDWTVLPRKEDLRTINLTTPTQPYSATSEKVPPTPYFSPGPKSTYTMGTHVIHPPHHLRGRVEPVLQTTNPVVPIDPETVLAVAQLERALPVDEATTFHRLHPAGQGKVYLAGSYAHPGIPLLEGCVGSARRAAAAITGRDEEELGLIDWQLGEGSLISRAWRWRRRAT